MNLLRKTAIVWLSVEVCMSRVRAPNQLDLKVGIEMVLPLQKSSIFHYYIRSH